MPPRADVVVLGAGVAGCVAALHLVRAGANVVVLDARAPGGGATGRSAGFLIRGTADHPDQVATLVGPERAVALFRYTAESLDELLGLLAEERVECALRQPGSLVLAVDEPEARSLDASVALVASVPEAGELWDAGTVRARTGFEGFAAGWFRPRDGMLDPALCAAGLAAAAERGGAHVLAGINVQRVEEDATGVTVQTERGAVRAARVLFALNAGLPALEPRFAAAITPVRAQMLATAPVPAAKIPWPVYAHHGYEYWRQEPTGELLFGGCRWAAQPGLERGVSDDASVSEDVFTAQRAFVARHLPAFAAAEVHCRWTGIMAFTPDAVPIVGAFPGSARRFVCAGWNGHGLALAPRSARLVTELLLGRAPTIQTPVDFSPTRFT